MQYSEKKLEAKAKQDIRMWMTRELKETQDMYMHMQKRCLEETVQKSQGKRDVKKRPEEDDQREDKTCHMEM